MEDPETVAYLWAAILLYLIHTMVSVGKVLVEQYKGIDDIFIINDVLLPATTPGLLVVLLLLLCLLLQQEERAAVLVGVHHGQIKRVA